jgi:hypothetical protein
MDNVIISKLPMSIQNQIPYSIRTKKDEYDINELPYNIQYIIKNYLNKTSTIEYTILYDVLPDILKIGDFKVISDYYSLVIEYLKNYLNLTKGQYPFDPLFYSKLKYYIQTKDTSTQYTLVVNEINRIANILSKDLSIPIYIKNVKINKINTTNIDVTYQINIDLLINNISKNVNIDII